MQYCVSFFLAKVMIVTLLTFFLLSFLHTSSIYLFIYLFIYLSIHLFISPAYLSTPIPSVSYLFFLLLICILSYLLFVPFLPPSFYPFSLPPFLYPSFLLPPSFLLLSFLPPICILPPSFFPSSFLVVNELLQS